MRIKLSATVPVAQYANLQPEVELEADSYKEGMAQCEAYITSFWNKHVEAGKQIKSSQGKKLTAFVGGDIFYDDAAHVYTNEAGEVYLSGSQYAAQFTKPFDARLMAGKMSEKWGVPAEDIIAMWELKSKISMGFGTALHGALELYGKYKDASEALEKTYHLHDHPVIKKAVEGFYASHNGESAKYEVLIVDHARKWAGQVDRLLVTGPNTCRVQDYKTNADLPKEKLNNYWKQLSFYAAIMQANGWKVEGLDIFHWNGEWKSYSTEVLKV